MNVDEMVAAFRKNYPGSSEEQVGFYRQACEAEAANPPTPVVEVDKPMPLIVVPPPQASSYHNALGQQRLTDQARQHYANALQAAWYPPVKQATDLREDLKKILLGTYGFSLRLSPAVQHRIRTENLSESELLGLIVHYT